jgi:hypothetical protein
MVRSLVNEITSVRSFASPSVGAALAAQMNGCGGI